MILKFKKFICSFFGCKIKKTLGPGFFHVECHRCGEVFKITRQEGGDWYDRAIQAILKDTSLFSSVHNISDYKNDPKVRGVK